MFTKITWQDWQFQSTLPARGATAAQALPDAGAGISIHAPRTGSDLTSDNIIHSLCVFQSTLPARGATGPLPSVSLFSTAFQSTLPARGATSARRCPSTRQGYFNPRSPHGERRDDLSGTAMGVSISIHAPRTGSDSPSTTYTVRPSHFQSTLPARGATAQSNNSVDQNHRLCTKSIPQNSPFENQLSRKCGNFAEKTAKSGANLPAKGWRLALRTGDSRGAPLQHQQPFRGVARLHANVLNPAFVVIAEVVKAQTVLFRVNQLPKFRLKQLVLCGIQRALKYGILHALTVDDAALGNLPQAAFAVCIDGGNIVGD